MQAPPDESGFEIKKENADAGADAFLGCEILYKWSAVGWIEEEFVKRNVDRRMKVGSGIVNSQLLCE